MNALPESLVNTFRANHQQNPDVVMLADGSYVVVWQSQSQDDGSTWGVYFQRFSADGAALGPELRANALAAGNQTNPHVAATSDGGFVITWDDASGIDGSSDAVVGQRYDAQGAAQGSNFVVNSTTANWQNDSEVVGYSGGFATVWIDYRSGGYDVYMQRWDNAGAKVGVET